MQTFEHWCDPQHLGGHLDVDIQCRHRVQEELKSAPAAEMTDPLKCAQLLRAFYNPLVVGHL